MVVYSKFNFGIDGAKDVRSKRPISNRDQVT